MKKVFKFISSILFLGIIFLTFLFVRDNIQDQGDLPEEDYHSQYICVLDREDKSIIAKLNSSSKAYPASLTKIMTTLVALEEIEDISQTAPVDVATYQDMVSKNASMAGFYGREPTSYRDLLYGTILSSGGEAANSLAINISNSTEEFVKLMNLKAKELELKDTNFTNPEGLHNKDQYTTAEDMAKLLDHALEDGDFRAIFTKESFLTTSTLDHPGGIQLRSTVLSVLHRFPQDGFQIIGGKSGTTSEAGQCWASLGIKDNKEYIVIVMGAELKDVSHPTNKHIEDTIKLYENIK